MSPRNREERKRLQRTAYHEAGHAVAHFYLHLPMRYATIRPDSREGSLGRLRGFKYPKHLTPDFGQEGPRVEWRLRAEIVSLLAGAEAERRKFKTARGTGRDNESAVDLMQHLAPFENQRAWWTILKNETRWLVKVRWRSVEAVARALLERETFKGSEVKQVIRDDLDIAYGPLPSPAVLKARARAAVEKRGMLKGRDAKQVIRDGLPKKETP